MSDKENSTDENKKPALLGGITVTLLKDIPTPFAYRKEDDPIVKSIFNAQEYLLPIENFQPKLILDCGGNIGSAAVYFANEYPDAQIYSVELEKDNFKLLKFNTALYDNIHSIKSALWDKETFVQLKKPSEKSTPLGFMTFETTADDKDAFDTTTVAKLLAESGFDEIDLLKVDIEGAEKEVFSAPDVDE